MATKNTKKTTVKKTVSKKTVVKKAAVAKPVVTKEISHTCDEHCGCGRHKHGFGHFVKKAIIVVLIFALGFVAAKMMGCPCPHHRNMMKQRQHPVFANGCLDIQSITNKKMAEALVNSKANEDQCISIEEYQMIAHSMKNKANFGRGMNAPMPGKPMPMPQQPNMAK